MRAFLLSLCLLSFGLYASAQAPTIVVDIHSTSACIPNNVNGTTFLFFGVSNATSWQWQFSSDGGNTWTPTTDGPLYIGSSTYELFLYPTIDMQHYQYRCIASNTSGSVTSSVGTLYIATSAPSVAPVIKPTPSTVCVGSMVTFQCLGRNEADTVLWASTGELTGNDLLSDTVQAIFTTTGTKALNIYSLSNGCGVYYPNPRPSISVTVNPLQAAPPLPSAGTSACTTSSVYTGFEGTTTTYSDATCSPIAGIQSSGSSPVTGSLQSCVTVATAVPSFNGLPYVARYYNLEPSVDAGTSTATVTLYFTQADFDTYNTAATAAGAPLLPQNSTDAAGIANIRISQFHGAGTTPDTYVGGSGTIDPADNDIVWDATNSRWSVTFDITGFSGFFISGASIVPLPLSLTNFTGQTVEGVNLLSWSTASEENTAYFEVQRTAAGSSSWLDLGRVGAAGNSSLVRQYSYADASAGGSVYSYRLKMVDLDGRFMYSPIVTLRPLTPALTVTVSPNPSVAPVSITVGSPSTGGATVAVLNMNGARLVERNIVLQKGDNALDPSLISGLPQGVYLLQVITGSQQQTVKVVKE